MSSKKQDRFRSLLNKNSIPDENPSKDKVFALDTQPENVATQVSSNETEKLNSETEHLNVSVKRNSEHVHETGLLNSSTDMEQLIPNVFDMEKRPRVEDTHTRQTYLIRNDLVERLDVIAKDRGKGFKTHLINRLLEQALDKLQLMDDVQKDQR